jgi:hypothetical protein
MNKLLLELKKGESKGYWHGSGYWLRVTNAGRKRHANRKGKWMVDDADVTGLVSTSNCQPSAGG